MIHYLRHPAFPYVGYVFAGLYFPESEHHSPVHYTNVCPPASTAEVAHNVVPKTYPGNVLRQSRMIISDKISVDVHPDGNPKVTRPGNDQSSKQVYSIVITYVLTPTYSACTKHAESDAADLSQVNLTPSIQIRQFCVDP